MAQEYNIAMICNTDGMIGKTVADHIEPTTLELWNKSIEISSNYVKRR